MVAVTLYDASNGEVISVVDVSPPEFVQQYVSGLPQGVKAVEGVYSRNDYYIDSQGTPTLKASMPVVVDKTVLSADGNDKVVLSGIPTGAEAFVNLQSVGVVNDGILEFSVTKAGEYTILLRSAGYRDFEVVVSAL